MTIQTNEKKSQNNNKPALFFVKRYAPLLKKQVSVVKCNERYNLNSRPNAQNHDSVQHFLGSVILPAVTGCKGN